MKNYLLGIAVFVLAFALSVGYAGDEKEKSKEGQAEKQKNCCMTKAKAEGDEHCVDVEGTTDEASMKSSECSDMWEKMASKSEGDKEGKMECCKGGKAKVKSTKTMKKSG